MGDNEGVDCSGLKVPKLKNILKDRGICSTSYTKRELVPLAKQAILLYDAHESDDHEAQALKRHRVVVDGSDLLLPDPSKIRSWTRDLSSLPALQSGHVIAYAGTFSFLQHFQLQ